MTARIEMPEIISSAEYRRRIAQRRKGKQPKAEYKPPVICNGCGNPKAACQCLEIRLLTQILAVGLPEPEVQYKAIPRRKFRWDFAWPSCWLLVEVQGGLYGGQGGHTSITGFSRDCEKRSLAAIHHWRVIECTGEQVHNGQALKWIEEALSS